MLSWVPDLNNLIQETCGCLLIEWTISNNTSTLLEFGRKRWRRYQDSVRPNFVYFEKMYYWKQQVKFLFPQRIMYHILIVDSKENSFDDGRAGKSLL